MKLIYRGISYEYNPTTVEVVPSVATGKYRGVEFRFSKVKNAPTMQPHYNLTYRGVKYNVKPNTDSISPVSEKAGTLKRMEA
ncbi:MAG: DUF4278 domain-containing protein [Okeania sp. SIO2C2]|uniref:DUF4278 domain-containing protein n=1 Tax=Okeania sp. SIO2C2 TaxID=2607787 RepID=UPI0013BD8691|nr:DUF4278 domain-containing protein [Okeania sp. SIO2C2]NEP85787.1 DUF4278 domain-containing protein [Okeania sp. SIO2C2]